jgi:hypothetical protein
MNKKFITLPLLLILTLYSFANRPRKKSEMGLFLGTSSYLGDINPSQLFYRPGISIGAIYRLKLNDTYSLRAQCIYGQFSGNDRDFANTYQILRNASFSSNVLDFNIIGEYNFLPFKYDVRRFCYTPFLFIGFGYNYVLSGTQKVENCLDIPFGVGFKYAVNKNITIGAEYSFKKLLGDYADGVANVGGDKYKTTFSNKDWFSFAGFFITFGLFNRSECPGIQLKK